MSNKKLIDIVPYVLTGTYRTKEAIFDMTKRWNPKEVEESISKVEERYHKRTGEDMTGYSGLLMFSDIIKYFSEFPKNTLYQSQKDLILKAQKRVLYYHNKQYEPIKSNGEKS